MYNKHWCPIYLNLLGMPSFLGNGETQKIRVQKTQKGSIKQTKKL
jgi:hypothetical protein